MTCDTTVETMIRRFAERPWRTITDHDLAPASHVPTMLSHEESQLYYWLARDLATQAGAIVDLGAFVGGSTARLGAGGGAAGSPRIIAYDRFTADTQTKERILYKGGIPAFEGRDILLLAHRLLTPFKPAVELRAGEIEEQIWADGQIDILIVDIAKSATSADHVAQTFFPHLVAGQSIVVHQDFLHRFQPWLPAQMALLQEYFTPLARISNHSIVFLCTKVPPPDAIAQARTGPLSDTELTRLVRASALRYRALASRFWFASMVREIAAHPEARTAWQLRQPRCPA